MTRDTRIALFLMGELVAALRANDPDAFRGLLSEGMQELGVTEVEELLLALAGSAEAAVPLEPLELSEAVCVALANGGDAPLLVASFRRPVVP